jgi:hypothetical protein
MWNIKRFVVTAIIAATGIVTEVLKISVNNRKAFNRLSAINSHAKNVPHNTENDTIRNLKPE